MDPYQYPEGDLNDFYLLMELIIREQKSGQGEGLKEDKVINVNFHPLMKVIIKQKLQEFP